MQSLTKRFVAGITFGLCGWMFFAVLFGVVTTAVHADDLTEAIDQVSATSRSLLDSEKGKGDYGNPYWPGIRHVGSIATSGGLGQKGRYR